MASVFWIKVTVFATFGTVLSIIDLRSFRLPHRLTLPMAGFGFLFSFVPGNGLSPWEAFLGFTVGIVPLGILSWNRQKTFGFGDAVFSGAIGAFSGTIGLGIALLAGGLFALAFTRIRPRQGILPFGPFLAIGVLSGFFLISIFQLGGPLHF